MLKVVSTYDIYDRNYTEVGLETTFQKYKQIFNLPTYMFQFSNT